MSLLATQIFVIFLIGILVIFVRAEIKLSCMEEELKRFLGEPMQNPKLTESELTTVMEIARVALSEKPGLIMEKLDIDDGEVIDLLGKLNKIMNPE